MRLYEVEKKEYSIKYIVDQIEQNCQPWLQKINPTNFVYRGLEFETSFQKMTVSKNRKPKDSNWNKHHLLNFLIEKAGLTANRSNSTFATSSIYMAEHFGQIYIFYPIGDFNYSWSPINQDWFVVRDIFHNVFEISNESFNELRKIVLNSDIHINRFFLKFENLEYESLESQGLFIRFLEIITEKLGMEYIEKYFEINKQELNNYVKGNDGTLQEAVNSGHEIMIDCNEYYIINKDYKNQLIKEFERRGY